MNYSIFQCHTKYIIYTHLYINYILLKFLTQVKNMK